MSYDGNMEFDKHTPQIVKQLITAERKAAMLARLQGVCVEVMEWADAQDEERRPEWVEKLERVLEERP
jgi:hypothetical protein